MKNIFFGLLAMILFSNFSFAQTLMSDDDHRIMMNNYAASLNKVLAASLPVNTTIDQYKRGIVNRTFILSSQDQASILSHADSLKTYGQAFAIANRLNASTDALQYFYGTFAPSTEVENGQLVESTAGLTATKMWTCALNSFGTDNCGSSAIVGDKYDLNMFATASVSRLKTVPAVGDMGVLVMLDGFDYCMNTRIKPELFDFVGEAHNGALDYTYNTVISKISRFTFTDIKNSDDYYLDYLYKYSDNTVSDDSTITETYIDDIVTNSQSYPLSYFVPTFSATAKTYLDRLGAIIDEDLSRFYDDNTALILKIGKINDLNREIARSNLEDFEVSSLLMANSIGKSSLQYWKSNSNNWNQYTTMKMPWSGMPWWKYPLCDIGGFVNGLSQLTGDQAGDLAGDVGTAMGSSGLTLWGSLIKIYKAIKPALKVGAHSSGIGMGE